MPHLDDATIRTAAFSWLEKQTEIHGDVLSYRLLRTGFSVGGVQVPLQTQRGIHKPAVMRDAPLTITSTAKGPYADSFGDDGLLRYAYCKGGPDHPDNRGLRHAMREQLPLIYFHAVVKGEYLAAWPVFIVGDDSRREFVRVALDDSRWERGFDREAAYVADENDAARRKYITATFRRRLHQRGFRERVLRAYQSTCAMCHFRHRELLDAAHITPDTDPEGDPLVSNGLSLCKIHHAAFDRFFLAVRPDYTIEVRSDLLEETDGPMLKHGVQELHGRSIILPRSKRLRPDPSRLEKRYQEFLGA